MIGLPLTMGFIAKYLFALAAFREAALLRGKRTADTDSVLAVLVPRRRPSRLCCSPRPRS